MKTIIVERLVTSVKTVLMEENRIKDIVIDNNIYKSIVSDIYRGRVEKVLKGMSACFVDIGREKNGYLKLDKDTKVKTGDDIIVQVIKDEVGDKGARLSTEISISGRYAVYIPSNDRITISNRIKDEQERMKLKKEFYSVCGEKRGYIIRTEAVGCSGEDFRKDIEKLEYEYEDVLKESRRGIGPRLLKGKRDSAHKYITDNVNEDVDKIVVNNRNDYEAAKKIVRRINPEYMKKVVLEENRDIFDLYGVEKEIKKALSKKVWLKSGGYLVIEKTEAMTVIDVNSGKFTGIGDMEETAVKINLDAANEVAYQVMLRDISGIIIVDFVEMKSRKNKEILVKELKELFSRDRKKTQITGPTSLGLIEIARRRDRESMENYYLKKCSRCGSEKGEMSEYAVIDEIEKEIMRITENTVYRNFDVYIHNNASEIIESDYRNLIEEIEKKYSVSLKIKGTNLGNRPEIRISK